MAAWLVKTDPEDFSIDDFEREKVTGWTGVRNYAARNYLRQMMKGDDVLFYHSGKEPSIVGMAKVAKIAYTDPEAEKGEWYAVDLLFRKRFKNSITLTEMKKDKRLSAMKLFSQSRLSVMPVSENEFQTVLALSEG